MIDRRDIRHAVSDKEQGTLTLTRQRTDETIGYRIIYVIPAIVQVGKQLLLEGFQIIHSLIHSSPWGG